MGRLRFIYVSDLGTIALDKCLPVESLMHKFWFVGSEHTLWSWVRVQSCFGRYLLGWRFFMLACLSLKPLLSNCYWLHVLPKLSKCLQPFSHLSLSSFSLCSAPQKPTCTSEKKIKVVWKQQMLKVFPTNSGHIFSLYWVGKLYLPPPPFS